jgi:tetratricopeptide (TPR) repeat protein
MRRLSLALGLAIALALSVAAVPAAAQVNSLATSHQTALEFYRLGDWATAERILLEILSQAPDHHQARWTLANLYLNTGRAENARKLIAEVARRAKGDLAAQAQAWIDRNGGMEAPEAPRPFTPDASGSLTLAPAQDGFQLAEFPTAPLTLRIPEGYRLQSSNAERSGGAIHATYRFGPDGHPLDRLGLTVEVTTLARPEEAPLQQVSLSRAMLARDGLDRNTPFRERDQLVNGHHARFLGYSDPSTPQVQVLVLGIATERYRVILRSACHEDHLRTHLPRQHETLGSLRLR